MLVYNYYYIGIWAVVGVYSIFMTVQKSMQLEVDNKIKGEKIFIDSLTGIYNREFFIKSIEAKLRDKKRFSIIFMDMDNFKSVNDDLGHLAGDKALQEFATDIKKLLRKEDFLYRYGGDEFAIIVYDNNAANAVVSKLYTKKIEISHKDVSIDIKFSTGIYNCTGLEASYEEILGKVDAAMYEAKQKGGNQIVYVESDK
jgi:diguanylate cyclase (GGDEF)-like protein